MKEHKIQKKIQEEINKKTIPPEAFEPQQVLLVQKTTGEITQVADVMTADADIMRRTSNFRAQKTIKFAVILQDRLIEILPELQPIDAKVLLAIIAKLYLHNKSYKVSALELHKLLNLHYSTVTKAIRNLKEKGIIVNTGTAYKPVYFIDPTLTFKGTFAYQQKMNDQFQQKIKKVKNGQA